MILRGSGSSQEAPEEMPYLKKEVSEKWTRNLLFVGLILESFWGLFWGQKWSKKLAIGPKTNLENSGPRRPCAQAGSSFSSSVRCEVVCGRDFSCRCRVRGSRKVRCRLMCRWQQAFCSRCRSSCRCRRRCNRRYKDH